jgi:NADH-quinone oxidoreductase subunit L
MGKSAQVPLHVWLPDAMAGPTPASALIHAATMVAAGVYLVARALPIFEASGVALSVTLVVGALTALVGGLLATVQHDIKKVLAYSTISQLGYMFVGLGAAGAAAAAYHLVTHAFFKSLLFLGAGVIIHSCHTQDMREMGGLARRLPWTTATFTAGSLALAGIFPFSGFWSKDEILTVLLHGEHYVAFAAALGSAFVTAFYVARLWLRVFAGPAHADHAHEGHPTMLAPMVVLAALTAVVGFGGPALGGFLGHAIPWPEASTAAVSTAAALGGLALGWWVYGRPGAGERTARLRASAGFAYTALANKLYFDAAYERLVVRPYHALTGATAAFDLRGIDAAVNGVGEAWRRVSGIAAVVDLGVIDGSVNALAAGARRVGGLLRRVQAGRVQAYQRYVVGAVVLLLVAWIVGKGA